MSSTSQFFSDIAARSHDDTLRRVDGTIDFELADGPRTEHWTVTIRHGDVTVSNERPQDDVSCIVRCPLAIFDEIAAGHANAMTSMLRGEITAQGDLSILMQFQRVFPAPSEGGVRPRAATRSGGSS